MDAGPSRPRALLEENRQLRARLDDAEEALRAIRAGSLDALVIQTASGPQIYTLQGQDAETNRVRGAMLAQVSDAVIAVNPAYCVVYLNAAAERLYGLSSAAALGLPLTAIYETRWRQADDAVAADIALSARGAWRGEAVHIAQDGREIEVESSITVLHERDGQLSGMLAVVRDVSERKRREARVLVSEIRYRRLFEAAHDGVLMIDPSTSKIIDANPFMSKMLGYTHAALLGKEMFEIGLFKDAAESQQMVRHLKQSTQLRYDNLPLRNTDGTHRDVEVVANLYDENGTAVIQCNIRDITERRRAEDHVRMLMAEINHRAKNLLAVVQAVVHQTARFGDPLTFAARLSDRIDSLAAGQDLLVQNLWQGVGVAELVRAQMAHFQDLIGQRIFMTGPVCLLTAAAAQGIGMAIHELTTNATKYGALSTTHGEVRITWTVTDEEPALLLMCWVESGGPSVVQQAHSGFGQVIIGRMAAAAVDGAVTVLFEPGGVRWELTALAANAVSLPGSAPS